MLEFESVNLSSPSSPRSPTSVMGPLPVPVVTDSKEDKKLIRNERDNNDSGDKMIVGITLFQRRTFALVSTMQAN